MKFVKSLIWLGFTALLLVSIPKIAWVFRSFEGSQPVLVRVSGAQMDILWFIPLFVAICIDALTLALTYAMSIDKAKASQFSMWAFVALLCGLSYYCNLLYNYAHSPTGSVWMDSFVSFATPLIVSGVPLFALCYTLILSRIEGKGETLEEKATRLEAEKTAKSRIKATQSGRFTNPIKSLISGVNDVAKHAATTFGNVENPQVEVASVDSDPTPVPDGTPDVEKPEETQPEMREPRTDEIPAINAENAGVFATEETPESSKQNTASDVSLPRSTGKLSVSVKEAAVLLNLSESYVRELRTKRILRTPSRNRKLITIKSINDYANEQQKTAQGERQTDALPVAELVGIATENNGTMNDDTAPRPVVQPTRDMAG